MALRGQHGSRRFDFTRCIDISHPSSSHTQQNGEEWLEKWYEIPSWTFVRTWITDIMCIGSIIAMLVLGVVLLFVFAYWDFKFARNPVIPFRFIKNRTVVIGSLIGFFDFVRPLRPTDLLSITYIYLYAGIILHLVFISFRLRRRRQTLVPCQRELLHVDSDRRTYTLRHRCWI